MISYHSIALARFSSLVSMIIRKNRLKNRLIRFDIKTLGILSAIFLTPSLYAGAKAQLSIVPTSTSAIRLFSGETSTITYGVTAGGFVENIQVFPSSAESPLPSYMTASTRGNCLGATLAAGGSCQFTLSLAVAAGHAGQSFILAPRVSGNAGGVNSVPLMANRISVSIVKPPTATTIAITVSSALFSFNAASTSGTIGTGSSVITITNTGSSPALNVGALTLPSGITQSNHCGLSLAANSTCQITLSTAATPDSSQIIAISGTNTNRISLPVAPMSVRVYSPPVNPVPSNASLMIVKTCTTPEQLLLTNNSGTDLSGISVSKDIGLSDVDVTSAMTNCPTTLPAGKSCVLGITAPSNSGSANTQGNILINWASSQSGAVLTGVEANASPDLPTVGAFFSPTLLPNGDYVYSVDSGCNLVKAAAKVDQYTEGNGGDPDPVAGSVAWTTSGFVVTMVPNPADPAVSGAQNIGLAAGQINTTAVIYQAGALLTDYAAGLCSQYSEADSGTNYAGWYLPWDDGTSDTELAAMWQNLSQGSNINGFTGLAYYWSSNESSNSVLLANIRFFDNGNSTTNAKGGTGTYVRCSRALTY